MGGLSFLVYPWGFIVQGIALWHFVRRRPENYWLYIIIFGGVLGAGVYVVVEMIPDLGLPRGVPAIREAIADPVAGNADFGQSFGGESGRSSRTLF
jgi:hypothetical protein